MWKIVLGFILFAGLAMFIISKGGDKLDMGGEKHGAEATTAAEPASAPASAASEAAVPPAPAASPASAS